MRASAGRKLRFGSQSLLPLLWGRSRRMRASAGRKLRFGSQSLLPLLWGKEPEDGGKRRLKITLC